MKPVTRNFRRLACALTVVSFCAPGLAACGFQPLYAEHHNEVSVAGELTTVEVMPIKDRLGQVVFNALIDEITPTGNPAYPVYQLEVTVKSDREGLGFDNDETATRFNYTLIGKYKLREVETGQVIFEATSRSIAAYNVVDNQFATMTARQDAEERAAKDLSQSVKLHLTLFFKKRG
ncbi:MAG: hypothetical protein EP340_01895 [Alphaproteobacteria bacterium]|nr:MAG: hypothetical protein EP340_01895 [Alphaproteobacteria bacterium]